MYSHDEFTRTASLAAIDFWMGIMDIYGALLGIKPRAKLLGITSERFGAMTVIRPNVQGWQHLTLKKNLEAK